MNTRHFIEESLQGRQPLHTERPTLPDKAQLDAAEREFDRLVEAAQSYGRGKAGYKSKALKDRQEGNPPQVIAYADRANERLRRKYYNMLFRGKKANVAKTALARELACFIWGMMNEKFA